MARRRKRRRRGLGAIRTYDQGSLYSVSVGAGEVLRWRRGWPASGLHDLDSVWAQFDRRTGDLVDLECNKGSCHPFDGPALKALVDDMQCEATKPGRKARAPKDHCRNGGLGGRKRRKRKRRR